jgi:hypothetical protein
MLCSSQSFSQTNVEPEADEIEALRELAEGPAADREYIPLEIA